MDLSQPVGPIYLENFKASTTTEINEITDLVIHKLVQMQLIDQPSFAYYVTNFLIMVIESMPSQEIEKIVKALRTILRNRNRDCSLNKIPDTKTKNIRKLRPTLVIERDEISSAINCMDDF